MKLRLHHFKNALIGSKFAIRCSFEHRRSFKSSSIFLKHFVKEVLPIINTDTSQSYMFDLLVSANLYSEFDVEEIIAGIIATLPNSSHLSFKFDLEMPRRWWKCGGMKEICLPVNQISNWLTRKIKTHQQSGKKGEQNMAKERSLFISIDSGRVINYAAMSKCVEKVVLMLFMCVNRYNS